MSYLIGVNPRNGLRGDLHGQGLGYVGDLGGAAEKDALKIANATAKNQAAGELLARQIAWDNKAAALRAQLNTQNVIAKTSMIGSAQVLSASQIEAEIIRRIGRRPVAPVVTGTIVGRPSITGGGSSASPVFTGSGVAVASSGPSPFLILGGLVGVGLLVTLARRG